MAENVTLLPTAPVYTPSVADEVFTSGEAAAFLKVAPEVVVREATAGRVPGQLLGGEWRFVRSALIAWLSGPPGPAGDGADTVERMRQLDATAVAPETDEEFEAFRAILRAQRDEVDRFHGCGKYAPE